ncbi:MAG: PAS domain-containing sensor histidine kinase [Candidatus Muiribacteriota bacterium]
MTIKIFKKNPLTQIDKNWKYILFFFTFIYIFKAFFIETGPIYSTFLDFILVAFCCVLTFKNNLVKAVIFLTFYNLLIYCITSFSKINSIEIFSSKFINVYIPVFTFFLISYLFFKILFTKTTTLKIKILTSLIFLSIIPLVFFSIITEISLEEAFRLKNQSIVDNRLNGFYKKLKEEDEIDRKGINKLFDEIEFMIKDFKFLVLNREKNVVFQRNMDDYKQKSIIKNLNLKKKKVENDSQFYFSTDPNEEYFVLIKLPEIYYFDHELTQSAFLISLVLVILIIIVSQILSDFIIEPLKKLIKYMNEAKETGRFRPMKLQQTSYEITTLKKTFDEMSVEINNLILTLKNEIENRKITQKELNNMLEEVEQEEKRIRYIVENTRDIIWVLDSGFNLIYINQSCEELYGYTSEEFKNLSSLKLVFTQESNELFNSFISEVRRLEKSASMYNKSRTFNFEIKQVDKYNNSFWIEISAKVSFDEKGKFYEMLGVSRNISQRKKYEKHIENLNHKLVEANKELKTLDEMKTTLLSNVSHEFRTPLASVMGYLQLIVEKVAGPVNKKQEKYLNTINKNINQLNFLIEDLLSYSRLYLREVHLAIEDFNIYELGEEVIEYFNIKIKSKNIQLKSNFNQKTCYIEADRNRIKKVLISLLDNAVKFSEKGGLVEFYIEEAAEDVEIIIRDYGIGIDKNQKEAIFDIFYQIDNSRTRKYQGLGLGLAISKKILHMHGSKIKLFSQKNKKTEFNFKLKKRLKIFNKKNINDNNLINEKILLIGGDYSELTNDFLEILKKYDYSFKVNYQTQKFVQSFNHLKPAKIFITKGFDLGNWKKALNYIKSSKNPFVTVLLCSNLNKEDLNYVDKIITLPDDEQELKKIL